MSEITISTSGIIREINAKIDGHTFKVRKLGAGDQLDIQQKAMRLTQSMQRMSSLQDEIKAAEGDVKASSKLLKEMDDVLGYVNKASDEIGECYMRLFDDGTETQEHAKNLLNKYGIDGLRILNERAFEAAEKEEE